MFCAEYFGVLGSWSRREREREPCGLREGVHEAVDGREQAFDLQGCGGFPLDGLGDVGDRGFHGGWVDKVGRFEKTQEFMLEGWKL